MHLTVLCSSLLIFLSQNYHKSFYNLCCILGNFVPECILGIPFNHTYMFFSLQSALTKCGMIENHVFQGNEGFNCTGGDLFGIKTLFLCKRRYTNCFLLPRHTAQGYYVIVYNRGVYLTCLIIQPLHKSLLTTLFNFSNCKICNVHSCSW